MVRRVFIALLLLSIIGTPTRADDAVSRETIQAYLEQSIPSHLQIADWEYRIFPSQGSGRVSVAGTLINSEALFWRDPIERERLRQEMDDIGIYDDFYFVDSVRRLRFPSNQTSQVNYFLHAPRYPEGTVFDFTTELGYLETVNGASLTGTLQYQMENVRTMAQLNTWDIVIGTPAYQQMLDTLAREILSGTEWVSEMKAGVERIFRATNPTGFYYFTRGEPTPLFRIFIEADANGRMPDTLFEYSQTNVAEETATLQAQAEFLTGFNLGRTEIEAGSFYPISLRIDLNKHRPREGAMTLDVEIAFPTQSWGAVRLRTQVADTFTTGENRGDMLIVGAD